MRVLLYEPRLLQRSTSDDYCNALPVTTTATLSSHSTRSHTTVSFLLSVVLISRSSPSALHCLSCWLPLTTQFARRHNDIVKMAGQTARVTYYLTCVNSSRSVANSVGCFQRRLSVRLFVFLQDNFQTSKHRMMKLGGRCIVHKSRPSSILGS